MQELSREETVEQLAQISNVSVEEVEKYLSCGDEYIDGVSEEVKFVDGDEQLDYIYQNSGLDPEVIEKIAEAEFVFLYSEED